MSQRRHRSADVALWAVPLLAAAAVSELRRQQQRVLRRPQQQHRRRTATATRTTTPNYFWYYGGSGRRALGQRLHGGTAVVSTNVSENVKRGGFGSSAKSGGVGRTVVGPLERRVGH